MSELAYAIPITPGKEDLYRQTWYELEGARRDEYAEALKDAGITRLTMWHQQTPEGRTLAIVYLETTDADAVERFVSSDADISRWVMQRMQEIYGRDVSRPPLPVELDHDFRV
jgi:heme-degrading monooxygenase HmoA